MEPFDPMQQGEQTPQPQPEPAYAPEQPTEGYYHGIGAGQRETVYGDTPYTTYHTYQQYQQPPVAEPVNEKPPRKKRHIGKKMLTGLVCLIVAAVLVVVSSGVTALTTGLYLRREYMQMSEDMKLYFQDKLNALQEQIDGMEQTPPEGSGELSPEKESLTAREIYQQNVNSVVVITCSVTSQGTTGTSAGTGFVISEDGYMVTNHHVVDGASEITVTMAGNEEYTAKLVGSDATNDVAVLKVEAEGLTPVTIGSSAALAVGDQVVAIGNALGELSSSLTVGYVSGTDRDVSTDGTVINMIQTDVAINSGNSGGPLFNAKGEVVGITTAKYSGTTSSGASIEGIGFAIPIDDVLDIIDSLVEHGYVKSAYLGVYVQEVDSATANYYGFPVGAYVVSAEEGCCAAAAGVQAKDIILELGGYKIESISDLSRALRKLSPGDTVSMLVWRSGQEVILTITLDEKPQS